MVLLTEDYLEHHGIRGQKWGVRRYQNKDGSLTAAGRKRLSSGSGNSLAGAVERYKARRAAKANTKAKLAKQKQAEEAGSADYRKARAKKPKQMTTSELKEATDRLKLESQYNELAKKLHKETPKEYMKRVAVDIAKDYGQQVARHVMGKAVNKLFGAEIIKGLATKQNVDAGKDLADKIKDEVTKQLKSAQNTDQNNKDAEAKPGLGERAKQAAAKMRDKYGENAALNSAAKYATSEKQSIQDEFRREYEGRKVYEGEVVDDRPKNNNGNRPSTSTDMVPVYTIPDRPQLEDLRYDTRKKNRRR